MAKSGGVHRLARKSIYCSMSIPKTFYCCFFSTSGSNGHLRQLSVWTDTTIFHQSKIFFLEAIRTLSMFPLYKIECVSVYQNQLNSPTPTTLALHNYYYYYFLFFFNGREQKLNISCLPNFSEKSDFAGEAYIQILQKLCLLLKSGAWFKYGVKEHIPCIPPWSYKLWCHLLCC